MCLLFWKEDGGRKEGRETTLEGPAARWAGDGGGWAMNGTETVSEPRSPERKLLCLGNIFKLLFRKAHRSRTGATVEPMFVSL